MLTSRTRLLLTLVGAALAAATLAQPASAVTQRYASPAGSGTDCSAAKPCSIEEAIEAAGGSGEREVIVAPGDYWLPSTLETVYPATIHGVAGQPRPRLLFNGLGLDGLVIHNSTLRHVEIRRAPGTDTTALRATGSTVDQVFAKAYGASWTVAIKNSVIRNSIVVASGDWGDALQTDANGVDSAGTYRNVTAIATGSGGVGIKAWAFGNGDAVNVLARNVIARGGPGGSGFEARAVNPGTTAKITVGHSNFPDASTDGAGASIADGGGNQTSAPAFVNAAAGDYRQAPGSPTIDAGLAEFLSGAFDIDGDPRQIGGIDIGADEFVFAPAATTGPASAVTTQSATLSGSVNPNGVPTTYHFEYGPTAAYGSTTYTTGAGNGGTVAAAANLGGLSPATTYHYRIVATNSGGVTQGVDRTFTTSAPIAPPPSTPPPATPPPATPPPTTTPPVTSPSFAGVRLVSTRLSFARRSVVLTLNCPAATAGRCSGRTKLTARRRRPGARAVSTVALGRATFSIAAGKQAKVRVRVSRAGQRLLNRTRRLRGRASNAARDGAGQSKTTVAAVTIRRRHR
jgi:hypothetical protein